MTTVSHESSGALPERRRLFSQVLVHEMWASLAIAVMWLAVLFDEYTGDRLPQAGETIPPEDSSWAVELEQASATPDDGYYAGSIVGVLLRGLPPRA